MNGNREKSIVVEFGCDPLPAAYSIYNDAGLSGAKKRPGDFRRKPFDTNDLQLFLKTLEIVLRKGLTYADNYSIMGV